MRTTITIDDDVLARARRIAGKRHASFKFVINEALRSGLDQVEEPAERRPYHTEAHPMGVHRGYNLDNIQELLAQVEGEDAR
ncbi:MAG: type II toxin-antitoxin system VapB family antitoxin [Verrucomicrobiota bacterium]